MQIYKVDYGIVIPILLALYYRLVALHCQFTSFSPKGAQETIHLKWLQKDYKHLPEFKRIVRHRHLPKTTYKAAALTRTMTEAKMWKEERKAPSEPGTVQTEPLVPSFPLLNIAVEATTR
ncbi:Sof1-like protein [Dillenia turbinata]|uniref:Sof1-like protein n=1 Tax=Dillenia turbinata TaxID=194707 RepID=A0AAN8VLR1_9MAGN